MLLDYRIKNTVPAGNKTAWVKLDGDGSGRIKCLYNKQTGKVTINQWWLFTREQYSILTSKIRKDLHTE